MFNFLKITLLVLIFIFLNIGKMFAGEYSEEGYVTQVKANNIGATCFLMLSKKNKGENYQGGYWDCNSYAGQMLIELAKTSKIYGYKAIVTFDGDGEESKPIYDITIK